MQSLCILTITDHIDITPVVAIVDAPSREATLSYVGLVALAVDTREPNDSPSAAICGAVACANGLCVAQHSGGMGNQNIINTIIALTESELKSKQEIVNPMHSFADKSIQRL